MTKILHAIKKHQVTSLYAFIGLTILLASGIIVESSVLTISYCLLTFLGAMLAMNGFKWFIFLYVAQVFIYGFVAYSDGFYGEVIINWLVLFPMHLLTSIKLLKDKSLSRELRVRPIDLKTIILLVSFTVVVTAVYGFILSKLDSRLPYFNAFLSGISLSASYLTTKMMKQQWFVWIFFSMMLFIMWTDTFKEGVTQLPIILMVFLNLPVNVVGYLKWNKLAREQLQKT